MKSLSLQFAVAGILLSLGSDGFAAPTYFMVAPLAASRQSGPHEAPVSVSLLPQMLTPGAEGAPYQFDFRGLTQITGGPGIDGVIYGLTGGALPGGMTLGSDGVLRGVPIEPTPPEGQVFAVQAAYAGKTAEQTYTLNLSEMSITLASASLPEATRGKPYSFDFRPLATVQGGGGISQAQFTVPQAPLPAGLTLGQNGVISGTPSTANDSIRTPTFVVQGTYQSKTSQQSYALKVNEWYLAATSISVRDGHGCAITTSGGVKCWGNNGYGQLGDGTTVQNSMPVNVRGLPAGVMEIAVGERHSCALASRPSGQLNLNRVYCWGANESGQLGNGNFVSSAEPVEVSGLNDVRTISVGSTHSCAVTHGSGTTWCWGNNSQGQLGNKSTTSAFLPVSVFGAEQTRSVSAGKYSTCYVTAGGAAKCWGHNQGKLGNNSTADSTVPVQVHGLESGVASVFVGGTHACAIASSGGARCWGLNSSGQLGDGSQNASLVPVSVVGLYGGTAKLSLGDSHTCALSGGGMLQCWGSNVYGKLGNGTTVQSRTPVLILAGGGTDVAAGYYHSCALASNRAACWGYGGQGRLGNGRTTDSLEHVSVLDQESPTGGEGGDAM